MHVAMHPRIDMLILGFFCRIRDGITFSARCMHASWPWHAAVIASDITPQCNSIRPVTLHGQCHSHECGMNA